MRLKLRHWPGHFLLVHPSICTLTVPWCSIWLQGKSKNESEDEEESEEPEESEQEEEEEEQEEEEKKPAKKAKKVRGAGTLQAYKLSSSFWREILGKRVEYVMWQL